MAGLSENTSNQLLIYPNPTQNNINIEGLNEPTEYKVISIEGKEMKSGIITKSKSNISIEELSSGSYILTLGKKTYYIEKE